MSVKPMDQRNPNRLRYFLLGAVILLFVCLAGFLVYNIITSGGGDEVVQASATPVVEPTEEEAGPGGAEEATPTPTRVISEITPEATEEPTAAATQEPTTAPTVVLQPAPTSAPASSTLTTVVSMEPGPPTNVLQNGGFEAGFANNGVALSWTPFKNDSLIAAYSGEAPGPYVESGKSAQRITTSQAGVGNRYAGIYQQAAVIPGETYTLNMRGQIRTGFGDINQSSFGYRMQYAVSQRGVKNWEVIPDEEWLELPWDEQLLYASDTSFSDYTTKIVPTSETITLFIRTWNKWADPGEVQFTIDTVSLVGPSLVRTETQVMVDNAQSQGPTAASAAPSGGATPMVDKGLPVTGAEDTLNFMSDGRFWGALLILCLLAIGATFRAKWSH